MCAGQDWDTEDKEKETVQLTGCGQCGVCMCALRRGERGLKDLVIVIAPKGRGSTGKMQRRDLR